MKKSFILKTFCAIYFLSLLLPGTISAQRAGEVTLYEHYSFKGKSGYFSYRDGGSNKISDLKIGDNNLSSLKVGEGIKVTLYYDNNSGPSISFYEGTYPELTCDWDNEITSMKIEEVDPKDQVVMFYMNGRSSPNQRQGLGVGNWDFRTKGASPEIMCDNTITRLVVPAGVTVELWEHPEFEGQNVEYGEGDHDLQRTTFDNMTSSIKIIPRLYAMEEIEFYGERIINAKPEDMMSASMVKENNTTEKQSSDITITESFASSWEKTESSTVGGETSLTTTVSASGGFKPIGIGGSAEVSIAASISASYSESTSKSKGETKGVEVSCSDNLTVPAGAKYKVTMTVVPVIKEYKIRHIYYPVDAKGKRISGGKRKVFEAGKIRMKYASKNCSIKADIVSPGGGEISDSNNKSRMVKNGDRIALKASNGKYFSARTNVDGSPIRATQAERRGWEVFTVVDAGAGKIALKAHNDKYLSVRSNEDEKHPPLRASADQIKGWESLTIEEVGNGKVTIKAHNGKYFSAWMRSDRQNVPVLAWAPTARDWETFELIVLD